MTKYRVVEKSDGKFYLEEKSIFIWFKVLNLLNDQIKFNTLEEAKRWIKAKQEPTKVKIHRI